MIECVRRESGGATSRGSLREVMRRRTRGGERKVHDHDERKCGEGGQGGCLRLEWSSWRADRARLQRWPSPCKSDDEEVGSSSARAANLHRVRWILFAQHERPAE